MPTIVDAIFVELGLDPSKFETGQKRANEAFKKTRESADNFSKGVEASGNKAAAAIETVALKALALFALFSGAKSIGQFAKDVGIADAALGRLSANIGSTPREMSAMANAVERNGGKAQSATASFKALSDSLTELQTRGKSGNLEALMQLQGLSGVPIDMQHGFEKALPGISNALAALKNDADPTRRRQGNWLGRQLGLDEESINWLQQGWQKAQADIAESIRIGVASPENARASQGLLGSWAALQQAADDLGRTIDEKLNPHIKGVTDAMKDWWETNKGWIETKIGDAIDGVADAVARAGSNIANSKEWQTFKADVSGAFGGGFKDFLTYMNNPDSWLGFKSIISGMEYAIKKLIAAWDLLFRAARFAMGFAAGKDWDELVKQFNSDPLGVQNGGGAAGGSNSGGGNMTGLRRGRRGIVDAGGSGGVASGVSPVSANIPKEGRALLDTISSGEASGYNVINGGDTFSDYSRHPYEGLSTNRGGRASGRYQDLPNTWARIQKATGLKDFSPANQDAGNWWLAQDDYKRRTGRNLLEDLRSNDPAILASIGSNLQPTWTSLNSSFGRKYGRYLGRLNQSAPSSETTPPGYGAPGSGGPRPVPHIQPLGAPIPNAAHFAPHGLIGMRAAAGNISHDNRNQSRSSETSIGEIHVHTQAKDADGIAKDLRPAINNHSFAIHANYGPA